MRRYIPARLTALLLALAVLTALIPAPASAAAAVHFTDVPSSHWAYQYVERAYQDGAIVGTGGDPASGTGTFAPDASMTYGQFLTMLVNAFYPEELARTSKEGPWYAPALRVAVDRQLTFSSLDDLMGLAPYPIDRYNMAWILVRILDDKCVVLPDDGERAAAAARIGDWSAVSASSRYWEYYVSSIYAMGIISGVDGNGTFAGSAPVTRASAAVIYARTADKLRAGQNDPRTFQITFAGDWSAAPAGFQEALEEEFYAVYPRLWARWGNSNVSKHISVQLSPQEELEDNAALTYHEFDPVRYQRSPRIGLSMEDVAKRPSERMVFAHELAHAATTNMSSNIGSSTWLVECLADYGAFRYACWADEQYLSISFYYEAEEAALRDWRYAAYGDSLWFFAYLDDKYPTTAASYGLVDAILLAIQNGQVTTDGGSAQDDDALNALVRQMTGYASLEALRQRYVQELDAGTWTFNGFAGYRDNYITEGLPGVADPTYPAGEGLDLCAGAYTYGVSGQASLQTEGNCLVDGDRSTTKWEASQSDVKDRSKMNQDAQHDLCISLGRPVTFDTYILYHEGSQGNGQKDTRAWRISYYDPAQKKWLRLDEVRGNDQDVTTRTFAPVTAQHLWLEILNASGTGDGTVRLYELELYHNG